MKRMFELFGCNSKSNFPAISSVVSTFGRLLVLLLVLVFVLVLVLVLVPVQLAAWCLLLARLLGGGS